MSASRNGKMSMPVRPSAYIYSQFKHVSGVPAQKGVRGVAINKLKILDSLIEQLGSARKRGAGTERAWGEGMTEQRLDALITQYEGQIKAAKAAQSVMPYIRAPAIAGGAVVDLVA